MNNIISRMVRRRAEAPLYLLGLALFSYLFVVNAWLSDDAFITFRTADNFVQGHGLRWNVVERVQAYTHPLWMMLVIVARAISTNLVFGVLAVSWLLSTAAISIAMYAVKRRGSNATACALAVTLLCSQAFVDFTSSGLENPLAYLMCAIFFTACTSWYDAVTPRRLTILITLCSLAYLTRPDLVILMAVPALHMSYRCGQVHGGRTVAQAMAIGAIPAMLWTGFSLFYYGFPFPNTAYAKLGAGIPLSALFMQGLKYFATSLYHDPLTPIVILLAVALPALAFNATSLAFSSSLLIYLVYVTAIGGDFMSGRFLSVPFFLGAILVLSTTWSVRRAAFAMALCALTLSIRFTTPAQAASSPRERLADAWNIKNARSGTYSQTGLISYIRNNGRIDNASTRRAKLIRGIHKKAVAAGAVGVFGYYAGPDLTVVDYYALGDPLLARLPAKQFKRIKAGHFSRRLPPGYLESMARNTNMLRDDNLRSYYSQIQLITRGPLLSAARFKAIVGMNTGQFDHLISRYWELARN